MHFDYPTKDEPATAEYVLSVFQDMHRQSAQFDSEVYFNEELTLDTTILEWRDQCDLLEWKELGHAYNKFFRIDLSDAEWRAALEPAHSNTLRGVCELVAKHAVRPTIQPAHLLGPPCHTAGAFLTIRSLLYRDGAAVSDIRPSSELAEYARHHVRALLEGFARIAPGVVPPVRIRTPVYDRLVCGLTLTLLAVLAAALLQSPVISVVCFGIFFLLRSVLNNVARTVPPESVEFGDLKTFRDLAVLLSQQHNCSR